MVRSLVDRTFQLRPALLKVHGLELRALRQVLRGGIGEIPAASEIQVLKLRTLQQVGESCVCELGTAPEAQSLELFALRHELGGFVG